MTRTARVARTAQTAELDLFRLYLDVGSGGAVRLAPGRQVLHLCHLVDQVGAAPRRPPAAAPPAAPVSVGHWSGWHATDALGQGITEGGAPEESSVADRRLPGAEDSPSGYRR
jgi:hypothetical protein